MMSLLARFAREHLGHPDRLDDLLELALDRPVRVLDEVFRKQPRPDQLLGDRRGATAVAADGIEAGRDDRHRVEARVVPERLVLDGGRRVEEDRRDLLVGHDLATLVAEAGQLGLAGPVVDDQFLDRRDRGQGTHIWQAGGEAVVDADHGERPDQPDPRQEQQDDHADDSRPWTGWIAGCGRDGLARCGRRSRRADSSGMVGVPRSRSMDRGMARAAQGCRNSRFSAGYRVH